MRPVTEHFSSVTGLIRSFKFKGIIFSCVFRDMILSDVTVKSPGV